MAKVAIIVDEMFEDSEFRVPYDALKDAGHEPVIVGLAAGKRLEGERRRERIVTDAAAKDVSADGFDALVIPGGYSPDHLRVDIDAVRFTRDFYKAEKPIFAICHAGSMLIEADVADLRTVTSWRSIKTDLINAGAEWVDRELVEDGNIFTSRSPADLPAFCRALLACLSASDRPERGEATPARAG